MFNKYKEGGRDLTDEQNIAIKKVHDALIDTLIEIKADPADAIPAFVLLLSGIIAKGKDKKLGKKAVREISECLGNLIKGEGGV